MVSSISPSKLENAVDERMFILDLIPRKNKFASLDLEAGKYEISLNITNFNDP